MTKDEVEAEINRRIGELPKGLSIDEYARECVVIMVDVANNPIVDKCVRQCVSLLARVVAEVVGE